MTADHEVEGTTSAIPTIASKQTQLIPLLFHQNANPMIIAVENNHHGLHKKRATPSLRKRN
jgi:hypothetical protein